MNKYLPERNISQVATGDVASLFSPAAYLSALWKEASTLHPKDHPYSLKVRRPDIGQLLLTQDNMDTEVSTLDLSNALLSSRLLKSIRARYIMLRRQPEPLRKQYMGFTELEIISDGVNIASSAKLTSTTNLWFQNQGLDRLTDGSLFDIPAGSSTEVTGDFWFLADLGQDRNIDSVKWYGRSTTPVAYERERNMTVFTIPDGAIESAANVPSYTQLMATPGVSHYSWGTTNDMGETIASGRKSTYTMTPANATMVSIPFSLLATHPQTGYFHQPARALRAVLSGLSSDESALFIDKAIADYVCAGISPTAPEGEADVVAKMAQVWRLTQFHGMKEEDARIICGFTLSKTSEKDEMTGKRVSSQFDRLFGQEGEVLLASKDGKEIRHILTRAYSLTDEQLTLFFGLEGINSIPTGMTLNTASAVYSWVLLSRTLGCTAFDLMMLNHMTMPKNQWCRYEKYKGVLEWMTAHNISMDVLLRMLSSPYPVAAIPNVDNVIDALRREKTMPTGMTRHNLEAELSTAYGLSSAGQAKAVVDWLDSSLPAGTMNSAGFMTEAGKAVGRYVMLRRSEASCFDLAGAEVWVNGEDVALGKDVLVGPQGYYPGEGSSHLTDGKTHTFYASLGPDSLSGNLNAWVQIDLGKLYAIDSIRLIPRSSHESRMTNCYIYVSDTDMSGWTEASLPGVSDSRFTMVGKTAPSARTLPQSFSLDMSESALNYLGRLTQRMMAVSSLSLTESIVSVLANSPEMISTPNVPELSLTRLRELSQLNAATTRCGSDAPAFLKKLSDNKLTVSDLAHFTRLGESVVEQALPEGHAVGNAMSLTAVTQTLDTIMLGQRTGLSLVNIARLRALNKESSFTAWQYVAASITAELQTPARKFLQQGLAEELSVALGKLLAYHNSQVSGTDPVKNADYFLIDPLVSGQTQTSVLAWATGCVQLYVERCMNGKEPGVTSRSQIKDRKFFADWDRYNKRYSQWAGLQRLIAQPENFIDPSRRLHATEAFKHMEQLLNSGHLNEETAEDAFGAYLAEFEQMSEIRTVSSYRESVETTMGRVLFLGQSQGSPAQWYWRCLDLSKLRAGGPPAHAWSGWRKIEVAANPCSNSQLHRPHMALISFHNRLHLLWLERLEKPMSTASDRTQSLYTLKSSYQKYDGSWSEPASVVTDYDYTPYSEGSLTSTCTVDQDLQRIKFVLFTEFEGKQYHSKVWLIDRHYNVTGECNTNIRSLSSNGGLWDNEIIVQSPVGAKVESSEDTMYITPKTKPSLVWYLSWKLIPVFPQGQLNIPLSTDFPTRLLALAARGTDAVFALTEDRKKPQELNKKLDFDGSYGSYYWELFYHVPLVISQRLQQQQNYTGAAKWQEYIFNSVGYPQQESTIEIPSRSARYVMLRRVGTGRFDLNEIEVMANGKNRALGASVSLGPQGFANLFPASNLVNGQHDSDYSAEKESSNAWVQVDLGGLYHIDSIRLMPRSGFSERMTNCHIYKSHLDMTQWGNYGTVSDLDRSFHLIGITESTASNLPQLFHLKPRYWNPLPLVNNEAWDLLDSSTTDPDVIAETDPVHYKLATFMQQLDLLIARGDTAYRLLERDTLVEAGMWYKEVLHLLGDQPESQNVTVALPAVEEAAREHFLPQENEKLSGYWLLIRQRLYNLRHNLTLDGQPLSLPLYASPASPADLLSASLTAVNGGPELPVANMGLVRFKPALEQARSLAGQLVQFGSTLQGLAERQDAEAMNQLVQTQGEQLLVIASEMQSRTLDELDAELERVQAQRTGINLRQSYYQIQYDGDISADEQNALDLNKSSAAMLIAGGISHLIGGTADTFPNIFGLAGGGSRWGGIPNGIGSLLSSTASALSTTAGILAQSDAYRRRRDEWKLQLDSSRNELQQLDKQEAALKIRREAADMQKTSLLTQQRQTREQLEFLKSKFTSQQLYSWLRSRLSGIFWQFFDISVSAALRAEQAWQFETGKTSQRFIRPGAWQSKTAGLLCGESLLLDLAHMESAWNEWDKRALEVTRTVSVASVLKAATPGDTNVRGLTEAITRLMTNNGTSYSWAVGTGANAARHDLNMTGDTLDCQINLGALNIPADYPDSLSLGKVRRIKNISVSLPALVGPYQDVRAVLGYSESGTTLPKGCSAIAVSHGVNDSGQFQLDFNDPRYLPFEGVVLPTPENNKGAMLTLRFPDARTSQKTLLASLNDIILHIHYTIRD